MRENSTNICKLKDIFRIVLELEASDPIVEELTIIEGINLEDLYSKLKEKLNMPYDRYFWSNFYDRTLSNRLLLSILEVQISFPYSCTSSKLNSQPFIRICPE